MSIEIFIRQLARSGYWQEIYRTSKDCAGIYLFENQTNISGIQYLFLYWLRVYNLLYTEMSSNEWQNLDMDVIEDNDRCDAFLYFRRKKIDKERHENKKQQKKVGKKKGQRDFSLYKGSK